MSTHEDDEGSDVDWFCQKLRSTGVKDAPKERRCWLTDIERGDPYDDGDKKCVTVTRYYECDDGGSYTVVKTICVAKPGGKSCKK